jgi:hypothetical protein
LFIMEISPLSERKLTKHFCLARSAKMFHVEHFS